jgi:hypothetical protein
MTMNILGRLFGPRRHPPPTPSPDEVARVNVRRMIAVARERGDRRSEPEVVAGLLVGAEFTAERHPDPELRGRAAAAAYATRDWLVGEVGEEEAVRLLSTSDGPVDEQGRISRR